MFRIVDGGLGISTDCPLNLERSKCISKSPYILLFLTGFTLTILFLQDKGQWFLAIKRKMSLIRVLLISSLLNVPLVYAQTAVEYYKNGNADRDQRNLVEAIYNYSKAIEINPNYLEAYNNRGMAYADVLDYNSAISDFNKIIQINPHYLKAYVNLGAVYLSQKKFNKAESVFNNVLEINPKDDNVYSNFGYIYLEQGQYQKAISYFSKAINLNFLNEIAINDRAKAYFWVKEYEKAWEDVEKVQELGYTVDPYFINQLKIASGKKGSFNKLKSETRL